MKLAKTLAVCAALVLVACAGIKAREHVQMPAMSAAYQAVILPHVERGAVAGGIPVPLAAAGLGDALKGDDRGAVAAFLGVWRNELRPLFAAGVAARVDAGELGPNGARVLMETAVRFDANMTLLGER